MNKKPITIETVEREREREREREYSLFNSRISRL